MTGLFVAAAAVLAAASPDGLQQPAYAPAPAWVRPLAIPREAKPSGAATDVLLVSSQARFAPGDEQAFLEIATRINTSEGLQQAANIAQVWDPATQTLAIHRARILRGDKVIDLLADGKRYTVLRREANLEAAMLDGQLTATLQPEGLQVGDIVDVAFTLERHEPALAGHAEGGAATPHAGAVSHLYTRILWPAGQPFHTWKTDDMPVLTPTTHDGWTEVVADRADSVSPVPPTEAPPSARLHDMMLASDFADWAAVSATAAPLYARAATLTAGSPLQAEVARIRAASADPKARALAALELVEGQTRYLALMMNAGGLTPAPADLTWSRRFGDCKGKVVLLLALLHGLGVEAEPALVNTTTGEALEQALPELESFDHVIVRAEIAGRTYWLDPTRMGDENLDVIPRPNYRWALPVRVGGTGLVRLEPDTPVLPLTEIVETVDLTAGVAKPARVHNELILRGDPGWAFGQIMQHASPVDRERALKAAFANADPWVTPDKVGFTYDPQKMEARASLDGTGVVPFTTENQASALDRDWMLSSSSIGYDPDFTRRFDFHRDAPYAVSFPAYARATVDVRLPDGGKGFESINGDSVARTIAGVEYTRAAAVIGDRFSMVASGRAVAQSFPASEATADADALRSLADYQVSLRYSALTQTGDVTHPPDGPPGSAAAASPAEAAETAFLARDYGVAEAQFSKALATDPDPKLYYDRGAARAAQGETALAKADFLSALKLDPKNTPASFALGNYALREGDGAETERRFSDALRYSAAPARLAARIAYLEAHAKRFAEAASYTSRAMAAETDPIERGAIQNAQCWARAIAGEDLQNALALCNASLKAVKDRSDVLDSRALVELRLGEFDAAIADYSGALADQPHLWTSLYGRGLAERRKGQTAAAAADMAAALEAHPEAKATFADWGMAD